MAAKRLLSSVVGNSAMIAFSAELGMVLGPHHPRSMPTTAGIAQ